MLKNPFLVYGYESPEYFCDREEDTKKLITTITNGNNVTLIAPRRMGKTGLVQHIFQQPSIKKNYNTFLIDLYATRSEEEMAYQMAKGILSALKPQGTTVMSKFLSALRSLRATLSFDQIGSPQFGIEIGEIHNPKATLDEIFEYLNNSDKPNLICLDEFQAVANYNKQTTEALLRTYIQQCQNARFIFSGSHRTMMSEMFLSYSRPFYQSTAILSLQPIPEDKYIEFAQHHFQLHGKTITDTAVKAIYKRFNGVTWYIQRLLNELFAQTNVNETCDMDNVENAITDIVKENAFHYEQLLYQLPTRQRLLLEVIANEGEAEKITSQHFLSKYHLPSASFVQSAIKGLLEKDLVTYSLGKYQLYDFFLQLYISRNT